VVSEFVGSLLPVTDVPEYPRLQQTQDVLLTRSWKARCWVGTVDQLVRIQREVEDALASAYATEAAALAAGNGGPAWSGEKLKELGSSLRLRVKVTGAGGKVTRTGELSAIFAEMDVSEVETVVLANQPEVTRTSVVLELRQNPDSGMPVRLKVQGDDRTWVGGTLEVLTSSLAKSKPWWSFMRSVPALFGVFLMLSAGVAGIVVALSEKAQDHAPSTFFFTIFGGLFLAIFLGFPLGSVVMPGFEIVEPGGAPTPRRVLGVTVAIVSFLVGVAGLVLTIVAL
jgi:hypothetical protein